MRSGGTIEGKIRKEINDSGVTETINQLNDDIETVTKYEFADEHYIFYKNVKHPTT